eukprot:GILK01002329.1.p1 GENE.GILK01002329.1~~GILK01002329.1.p1  ORF type:complete len:233 (+),score=32.12 GILK01002329.1:94-699(+)
MKANLGKPSRTKMPYLASECNSLSDAEYWRGDLIKQISRKVAEIQNAGLGEHRIRDLNDEINKLFGKKSHWEDRIKALGGADYKTSAPKMYDANGQELAGSGGYKYFGAARDLPGVRELFQREAPPPPRKTRAQLFKHIDPDYYGYRDEDDGHLLVAEAEAEKETIARKVREWQAANGSAKRQRTDEAENRSNTQTKVSQD